MCKLVKIGFGFTVELSFDLVANEPQIPGHIKREGGAILKGL